MSTDVLSPVIATNVAVKSDVIRLTFEVDLIDKDGPICWVNAYRGNPNDWWTFIFPDGTLEIIDGLDSVLINAKDTEVYDELVGVALAMGYYPTEPAIE